MCQYIMLSQSNLGVIKWCTVCENYNVAFNNIFMTLSEEAFGQFKDNVTRCYERCIVEPDDCSCSPVERRDIVFNTRLAGLELIFSMNEIRILLAMLQEAELQYLSADI